METVIILLTIGLLVGILGTIIGAGGGFILVPILILIFPEKALASYLFLKPVTTNDSKEDNNVIIEESTKESIFKTQKKGQVFY